MQSVSEHFSLTEIYHPTSQVWDMRMPIRMNEYCTGVSQTGDNKRPI